MLAVQPQPGKKSRLNLLLSEAEDTGTRWADLMPRLLEPLGVHSLRAHSGEEAASFIRREPIHLAVVDLAVPLSTPRPGQTSVEPGGVRILQLLSRLETPPPTVIVRRRQPNRTSDRQLINALQAGAFSVVDQPVDLELLLETLRRALRRFYKDAWPESG
ncbi:MAG TPA: response regulator transcription factor [Phycisphaeraceae bacterium]|nr:response regulator transcription factor [Phycisphaeraceae bacterium]